MICAYLRIKKDEEKALGNLSNELNKQRLDLNLGVMKESEILHELLQEAFKKARVEKGKIKID